MAEENQVTTKEPQRITTKNPKKVEAGRRLAAHNHRKREDAQSGAQSRVRQYYGIGAVIPVGVIGGLGYYLYQAKKGEVKDVSIPHNPTVSQQLSPQTNKFKMD